MNRPLRTEEEIRAAGAAAVAGWQLTPEQVDKIAALLGPVRGDTAKRDKRAA